MYYRIFAAALLPAALTTFGARAAETAAPPSATSANVRVPDVQYQSAFKDYQPFRAQNLAPWRELNDEVHKAGGHLGIFSSRPGVPQASSAHTAPAAASKPYPLEHKK